MTQMSKPLQTPNTLRDRSGLTLRWQVSLPHKASGRLQLDQDLLATLKKTGRGYKLRINQMLRSYLAEHPECLSDTHAA